MSELTQLRDYCDYLDEIQGEIDLIDVVPPVRPIDGFAREHREPRKWLVAVAAAVSILILVGGVAWLSPRDGLPPAAEPTTAVFVPPPGEGPTLDFVRVESPSYPGGIPGSSVWFKGVLYAIWSLDENRLYRTVDGITWDLLPGFPAGNSRELTTDGVRLVSATSLVKSIGVGFCWEGEPFFEVNTSTNGVDWTSSKIPLRVPEEVADVEGCFEADIGEIAVGPQGIIVTGISQDPSEEGVFRELAWYSRDGMTWRPLAETGPLQAWTTEGRVFSMVATLDGFVAASHGRLWETTDNGTTWTEGALLPVRPRGLSQPLDVWAGTPISASEQGVWTIEDTPRAVIPATGMNDMYHWVGEFGLFGIEKVNIVADGDEILFSEDGTTWNRWNPPELGPEAGRLWVVGIAEDFILLHQQGRGLDNGVLWIGTLP